MYQDSGIPAEKLPSLSDARLQELFSIPGAREHKPSGRQIRLEALLPEYAARLSRKGMTVKKLYEEYRATSASVRSSAGSVAANIFRSF